MLPYRPHAVQFLYVIKKGSAHIERLQFQTSFQLIRKFSFPCLIGGVSAFGDKADCVPLFIHLFNPSHFCFLKRDIKIILKPYLLSYNKRGKGEQAQTRRTLIGKKTLMDWIFRGSCEILYCRLYWKIMANKFPLFYFPLFLPNQPVFD